MLVTVVVVINYNVSVLFFTADVEDDTEKNTDKYDESVDEDNFTPFSKHISAIDNTQVIVDWKRYHHNFTIFQNVLILIILGVRKPPTIIDGIQVLLKKL